MAPSNGRGRAAQYSRIKFGVLRPTTLSNPSQRHTLNLVVGALAQDEPGALARGQDVLVEVLGVDGAPDLERLCARPVGRQMRVAVEVGCRIAECRLSEAHEARDVPVLDQLRVGVHV